MKLVSILLSLVLLSACSTPALFDVNHRSERVIDPDGGPAPLTEVGKARQKEAYEEQQRISEFNANQRQQALKNANAYQPVIGSKPMQAYEIKTQQPQQNVKMNCQSRISNGVAYTDCR